MHVCWQGIVDSYANVIPYIDVTRIWQKHSSVLVMCSVGPSIDFHLVTFKFVYDSFCNWTGRPAFLLSLLCVNCGREECSFSRLQDMSPHCYIPEWPRIGGCQHNGKTAMIEGRWDWLGKARSIFFFVMQIFSLFWQASQRKYELSSASLA